MPKTTNVITAGLEFAYNKVGFSANPVPYPLVKNQTYKKGSIAYMSYVSETNAGKLLPVTTIAELTSQGFAVGVMAGNYSPTEDGEYGLVYDNPWNIYRVNIGNFYDGEAAAGGDITTLPTGIAVSANNLLRGALVHLYEGPGAGATRIVSASTTLGVLTLDRALPVAPTTDTKFILLAPFDSEANGGDGEFDGVGIGPFTRGVFTFVDSDGATKLDAGESPEPFLIPSISDGEELETDLVIPGPFTVLNIDAENLIADLVLRSEVQMIG